MSAKDYLEKDYYKVLGVPKTAKADEIKSSYRKLARKYHPDANKGDRDAEERFKEISEAYNTLSDEKKRKEYDEARSMFGGGFRVPGAGGRAPGQAGGGFGFDLGDHALQRRCQRAPAFTDGRRQRLTARHRPQQHAHREQVGPLVDGALLQLLGRETAERVGRRALLVVAADAGEPEVDDLHDHPAAGLLRQEQVRRLDVAVEQAGVVRFGERAARLHQHVDHARRRLRPVCAHELREIDALEQLHHEEERSVVGDAVIVELDRVARAQRRERLLFVGLALMHPRVTGGAKGKVGSSVCIAEVMTISN